MRETRKVFSGIYRGVKCQIKYNLISIGLKPSVQITIDYNAKLNESELINKKDYLNKKYGKINLSFYLDAVVYFHLYNFKSPSFNVIKSNMDDLIDVLIAKGLVNELDDI
ncbi:MAG: hypothetical protein HRT66_12610 [Flavobacteriaceae bacterium]|nr:hypothetical protein [Flavobacteriaceae bacterium]